MHLKFHMMVSLLVISSFKEGTSFWDLEKKKPVYRWNHGKQSDSTISHIAFSPNNQFVITADKRSFVVWNSKTGEASDYWSTESDIMDAAISNDGNLALLGLKDGRAIHFNLQTQRRLEVIAHRDQTVTSVDLTASGQYAVTGGNDNRVVFWDSKSGKALNTITLNARVRLVRMDYTAPRLLIATEDNSAFIYNSKTGEQISPLAFKPRQGLVTAARFAYKKNLVLLGFPAREISLWDTETGLKLDKWRTPNKKWGCLHKARPHIAWPFHRKTISLPRHLMASWPNGS